MSDLPPEPSGPPKFEFPAAGFAHVADKFREADFFLERLLECEGHEEEAAYYLSAFASASRSVTFVMQAVMSKFPRFDEWYPAASQPLRDSELARYFVKVRNEVLKRGTMPTNWGGVSGDDGTVSYYSFTTHPGSDLPGPPIENVHLAAKTYMVELARLMCRCYRDYDAFVDPRVTLTRRGLATIGWTVADVLESMGYPRTWLEVAPKDGEDLLEQQLAVLSRYAGDEIVEDLLVKYGVA